MKKEQNQGEILLFFLINNRNIQAVIFSILNSIIPEGT